MLVLLSGCAHQIANRWIPVARQSMDSVVAVEMFEGNLRLTGGTGVFVRDDGYVLTNAHVVTEPGLEGALAPDIWIRLRDQRRFIAEIIFIDAATDVAVIRANVHGEPFVRLARRGPIAGQEVMMIGQAYPHEWTATTGVVSGLRGQEGRTWMQMTTPINPGCSGGPILNSRGRLVGINVAYSPYMQGVYWGIPVGEVKRSVGPIRELHMIEGKYPPASGG